MLLLLYIIILHNFLNRLAFIRHNNDDQTLTLITNLYLPVTYTIVKYLLTFYFNIY